MAPLLRLLRYARPHRKTVWLASACSVANKLVDLAPPVLIGAAVDTVVQQDSSVLASLGFGDAKAQLSALAVATVVIWLLESVFEYAFGVLWRNLAQTIEHELRLDAYAHVQGLDAGWFAEQRKGDVLAVLNDDVNQLERFLDGGANEILQVSTTVVAVSLAFFAASPSLAAVAMLPIPLVVVGSFWFQGSIAPRYAAVRKEVGRLNALLADNLRGVGTIQSFVAEEREVQRVRAASQAYRQANARAIALSAGYIPAIRMAIVVGFVFTLVLGGRMALTGALGVGVFSTLVYLTQRLLWPLTKLGQTVDLYQRAMASTERVLDLLAVRSEQVDGDRVLSTVSGDIGFQGVTFAYPGNHTPVLRDFTLRIEAGRTTAVVGSTGSGKTTLVRLLLRWFDPQEGSVTLDGVPLPELKRAELRRKVALVDQQVFLFPGSVAENLRYGRPDAPEADVRRAAADAEAAAFIDALPQGYETAVGEGGVKLSGGQRQRLCIARALLKDAPILVLDEATSAVDNETEEAIQRSLERVGRQRTVLVIAHRLSTIRHADRIVVLERGEVVEDGTHDDLVAKGGRYAKLWAVQTGEGRANEPSAATEAG